MSTDTTEPRRFGTQALASTLALLMLLGTGCSERKPRPPGNLRRRKLPPKPRPPIARCHPDCLCGRAEDLSDILPGLPCYGAAGAPKMVIKMPGHRALPRVMMPCFHRQERAQRHATEGYLHELQRGRTARSHGIHGRTGCLIVAR